MAERIRARVWILGLAPLAVGLVVVAILVALSERKPAPRPLPVASETPLAPEPIAAAAPPDLPAATSASPIAPPPAAAPPPPVVVAAASSVILAGPPPEPIPELDALARPPGSQDWSPQQKLDYREKTLAALDAKDRSLVREIAAARSRGDTQTLQQKQATLDYLRARRAQIDDLLRRVRESVQDAG